VTATPASEQPTIVIAAGGTAGHVVPALAIADALRAEGARVVFAGGQRAEAQLVPAAGYELEPLRVEGISRSNPLKAARAVVRAAGALGAARRVLDRHGADAVLGGGGYVAGPVGLAAVTKKIPVVLTEADSHLGLTNRLLAPRARRVCLAFPIAGREGERYLITGRPVPPTIDDRAGARAAFGIPPDATCVLIFGGSLGARSINLAAVEAFADAPYHVLHVPGARDFGALRAPGPNYVLREYINPFGSALAAADLVVARAGGSVFELAQYGLPAVLVPYPHASADHQTANARWMAEAGAATILRDDELTPQRLRAAVDGLLADPDRVRAMAAASRALARPDAAQVVAREVLAAAREAR
jgi:UDP-N-acetylglucosamine--N-acetylmuramyl-(pentapeptide) pyrophosphoryl-undecaprenol N-acetylglucosamine transferase